MFRKRFAAYPAAGHLSQKGAERLGDFDEISDFYDRKEDMSQVIKEHGGEEFFDEINAARIPFFFIAAVENTEADTEYLCKAVTPSSMGILLTVDKFNDFLNIRNKGFVAIPSMEDISPSIQSLKQFDEERQKDRGLFYSQEVLAKFNAENGVVIEDESMIVDDVDGDGPPISQTALNVLDSVMYTLNENSGQDQKPDKEETGKIQIFTFDDTPLVIEWGGGQATQKDYKDEFAEIDKRHEGILKGDGTFLQVKEREAVYFNMGQGAGIKGETGSGSQEEPGELDSTKAVDAETTR